MSADKELAFRPVSTLLEGLITGRFASTEIVGIFLERIARLGQTSNAYIEVTADTAMAAAAAADRARADGKAVGALCGIPYCLKDLIDVAGVRTTAGSRVLADNVATQNAFLVDQLEAAGAICLGKANLHEFAYGATGENPTYGTAVNAYDRSRLAGGSSSGSAAALAFGLTAAAFGTDTGGSVRVPAALNGLVGLKPTQGRISSQGVIPYAWSLDHVGILTRSVRDAALLLEATAGYNRHDPTSTAEPVEPFGEAVGGPISGLRVGIPRSFYFERCDPEILAASEVLMRRLEGLGARLEEVALPAMDEARTVSLTLQMPEALSYHSQYLEERGDLYGADFRAGLALGQCLLAEHYVRAKRMQAWYRASTNVVFDDIDLILTPATPLIAPKIGTVMVTIEGREESVGNALTRYTTFFNLTGHPAIVVPSGLHSAGLPMGVQLVAPHYDEATLFRAASAIETPGEFDLPLPPSV